MNILKKLLCRSIAASMGLMFCAIVAQATIVITPSNEQMVLNARLILTAKVLSVVSAPNGRSSGLPISTYITLRVKRVLKGQLSTEQIVLEEAGGQFSDMV
jgi:hypothetical protein